MSQQDRDILRVSLMSGAVLWLALTGTIQIFRLTRGARS